jgi:hypothetical protein
VDASDRWRCGHQAPMSACPWSRAPLSAGATPSRRRSMASDAAHRDGDDVGDPGRTVGLKRAVGRRPKVRKGMRGFRIGKVTHIASLDISTHVGKHTVMLRQFYTPRSSYHQIMVMPIMIMHNIVLRWEIERNPSLPLKRQY